LSFFIKDIDENRLRSMIVDYMRTDPILFDEDPPVSLSKVLEASNLGKLSEYCDHMNRTSTWGGALEIRMFCDLFCVTVHVKVLQTGKMIEFLPKEKNCTEIVPIYISWNGGHYEPIRS
jgi:hypothetical protein